MEVDHRHIKKHSRDCPTILCLKLYGTREPSKARTNGDSACKLKGIQRTQSSLCMHPNACLFDPVLSPPLCSVLPGAGDPAKNER